MPRRDVTVFLVATFATVWLASLPLWLAGGDVRDPALAPFLMIAMYTPALGVLVAALAGRQRLGDVLAFTGVTGVRPVRLVLAYCAAGLLLPPLLALAALPLAASAGTYEFSTAISPAHVAALLGPALAGLPLLMFFVFGEEVGWSYLLPKLLPLGLWPALLISGVIWGVFHAPFTLLGYHYPDQPGWVGIIAFTLASVLLGTLMAWLRLATGSIWPAVVAHAAANGVASQIPAAFGAATDSAGATFGTSLAGWPGWIAMAVAVAVLAATGLLAQASGSSRRDTELMQ
jgi:uncharacterized protein